MQLLIDLDGLNYHEAWIGEHHSGGFEIIACYRSSLSRLRPSARAYPARHRVVSLPYHNPFTLAGRMIQLDYIRAAAPCSASAPARSSMTQ